MHNLNFENISKTILEKEKVQSLNIPLLEDRIEK